MDRSATARVEEPIQLVLLDEHPLIRAGLRTLLEKDWGIEVVAETASIDETVSYCRQRRPDVLLLDLDLPTPGLLRSVQRLRRECSGCAVVVLVHRDDDEQLLRSVMAGANGHVAEGAEPREVALTIRRAANGEEPIGEILASRPSVSQRVLEAYRRLTVHGSSRRREDEAVPLSIRQITILRYAAEGLMNRQIARAMSLSEHTVKSEMSAILAELCLKHRTEAVVHAVRRGWISLPDPAAGGPQRGESSPPATHEISRKRPVATS